MRTWKMLLTLAFCLLTSTASAIVATDPCEPWYGDSTYVCIGAFKLEEMGYFQDKMFIYDSDFRSALPTQYTLPVIHENVKEPIAIGSISSDIWLRQTRQSADAFIGTPYEGAQHTRLSLGMYAQKDAYLIPCFYLRHHRLTGAQSISYAPDSNTSIRLRPYGGTPLMLTDIQKAEWQDLNGNWIASQPMSDERGHRKRWYFDSSHSIDYEYIRALIYSMDNFVGKKWTLNGNTFAYGVAGILASSPLFDATGYFRGIYIQWPWDTIAFAGDDYYVANDPPRLIPSEDSYNYVKLTLQDGRYKEFRFAVTNNEDLPAIEATVSQTTYTPVKDKDKSGKAIKVDATTHTVPNIVVRRMEDPNDVDPSNPANPGWTKRNGLVIQWPEADALLFGVTPRATTTPPIIIKSSSPNTEVRIVIASYGPTNANKEKTIVYTMMTCPPQGGTVVLSASEWDLHKSRSIELLGNSIQAAEITIQYRVNDNLFPERLFQRRGSSRGQAVCVPFNDNAPVSYSPPLN
jgi:hypothetical protein